MQDDEVADLRQEVISIVRENGWESLFGPISTPADVGAAAAKSRQEVRRLIDGLTKLVEMLPSLERSIAFGEQDVKVIAFETDGSEPSDDRALVLPKIEREAIAGQRDYGQLRETLRALRLEIEAYD